MTRHTLVSAALGSGRYPPTRVVLNRGPAPGSLVLMLHEEGTRRNVAHAVEPELLADDGLRLSHVLEAMLETLWPAPTPGRLP